MATKEKTKEAKVSGKKDKHNLPKGRLSDYFFKYPDGFISEIVNIKAVLR